MTRAAHGNARARRTARAEDRYLGIGPSIAYGLQHVLTMYGGIVAVPLIIGQAADLPSSQIGVLIAAALFMGGLATLVQTIGVPFFGSQLPLVQGVSFASVSTMVAIVVSGGGLASVLGAVMVSAAIGFLIAPFFSKVIKFLPPVVTGSIITTIGLTLMPVAAHWAMGGNSGAEDFGSVANIGLAALTLALVLLLSKVGVATISRLSILIALVLGTLFATVIGMADFSQVGEGPIFELPQPFFFGVPEFHIAAIISMVTAIISWTANCSTSKARRCRSYRMGPRSPASATTGRSNRADVSRQSVGGTIGMTSCQPPAIAGARSPDCAAFHAC